MLNTLFRRTRILAVSLIGALILIGASLGAYSAHYANHIVPGVTFMGEEISATTIEEFRTDIENRLTATTISFDLDNETTTASLTDLGVAVNVDEAVAAIQAPSNSFLQRLSVPFTGTNVELTSSIDETKLEAFTSALITKTATEVKDATVKFDEEKGAYTAIPAQAGKAANITHIKDTIDKALTTLAPVTLAVELNVKEPQVTTEEARAAAQKAQAFIDSDISLTDGIDTFSPSAADKAAWVTITQTNGEIKPPTVDSSKITEWVKTTAENTNVKPQPGVNNVNSRGDVVSVHEEGVTGWTVNNADAIAAAVEQSFREAKDYSGTFEYDETKPEMTTRLIADGGATHIYAAAPGEKWVDVNLSNASVTAYEGGTVVFGPIPMVPGAPETPTVTGKFRVWHQNPLQTMRGLNADGTTYETPNVPWATYFHGDFAFHGAPWRSSFGWSGPGGSHGCVNMPVDSAKWIYNFVDIGTVVVSHY